MHVCYFEVEKEYIKRREERGGGVNVRVLAPNMMMPLLSRKGMKVREFRVHRKYIVSFLS